MKRPVAAAVTAVLTLVVASSSVAAPAVNVPCDVISAERGVANPAVYCLSVSAAETVLLHRWTGGRWASTDTRVPADSEGAARLQLWPAPGGVVFSTGNRVYARAGSAPFALLYEDSRLTGVPGADVTPYVGPEPTSVTPFSIARAQAATVAATVYTAGGVGRTVVGAPTWTTHFVVPPDYAARGGAIAIGTMGSTRLDELSAFLCTGDFVCLDQRARLSDGYPQEGFFLDAARGVAFVEILDEWHSKHWRTADFGRTWQPWTSLDTLVSTLKAPIVHGAVRSRPGRASEVYGRFVARDPAKGTPDELWLFSADGGTSWRVVGRGFRAGRGHNTLPYVPTAKASVEAEFEVLPDGTLLVGAGPVAHAERWRRDGLRLRR